MSDVLRSEVMELFHFITKNNERKNNLYKSFLRDNPNTYLYFQDLNIYREEQLDVGEDIESSEELEMIEKDCIILLDEDNFYLIKKGTYSVNEFIELEEQAKKDYLINNDSLDFYLNQIEYFSFYQSYDSDENIEKSIFGSYEDYCKAFLPYLYEDYNDEISSLNIENMLNTSNILDKTMTLTINGKNEFGFEEDRKFLVIPLFISESKNTFDNGSGGSFVINDFSNRYSTISKEVSCLMIPIDEETNDVDLSSAFNVSLDELGDLMKMATAYGEVSKLKEDTITMSLFREFARKNKGKEEPEVVTHPSYENVSFGLEDEKYVLRYLDKDGKEKVRKFSNFEKVYSFDDDGLGHIEQRKFESNGSLEISKNFDTYHEYVLDLTNKNISKNIEGLRKNPLNGIISESFLQDYMLLDALHNDDDRDRESLNFDMDKIGNELLNKYIELVEKPTITASEIERFYEYFGFKDAFNRDEFEALSKGQKGYFIEDFYCNLNINKMDMLLRDDLGSGCVDLSSLEDLKGKTLKEKKEALSSSYRVFVEGLFDEYSMLPYEEDRGKVNLANYVDTFFERYPGYFSIDKKRVGGFKSPSNHFKEACALKIFNDDINEAVLRANFDNNISGNEVGLLVGYITSGYIVPTEGPELRALRKSYEDALYTFGKNEVKAKEELVRTIENLSYSNDSYIDNIFKQDTDNRKALNGYAEMISLDFDIVLQSVMNNLSVDDNNSLWIKQGSVVDFQIIKTSENLYCFNVYEKNNPNNLIRSFEGRNVDADFVTKYFHKDFLIKDGDLDKIKSEELIPKYMKEKYALLNRSFYGDTPIEGRDNHYTKVMKSLANGQTVLMKKRINKALDDEVLCFSRVGDKIVLKSMRCLDSKYTVDNLPKLNMVEDEVRTLSNEKHLVYKNKTTRQETLGVITREISPKELEETLRRLNLREWDTNFDSSYDATNYFVDGDKGKTFEKSSKAYKIESDMALLDVIKEKTMSLDDQVDEFLSKLHSHLGLKGNGEIESATYAFAPGGFGNSDVDTTRTIMNISKSEGDSKAYDLSLIIYDKGLPTVINIERAIVPSKNLDGVEDGLKLGFGETFVKSKIAELMSNRKDYVATRNVFNDEVKKDTFYKGYEAAFEFLNKYSSIYSNLQTLSADTKYVKNIINENINKDDISFSLISRDDGNLESLYKEFEKSTTYGPICVACRKQLVKEFKENNQNFENLLEDEKKSLICQRIDEVLKDFRQYDSILNQPGKILGTFNVSEMFCGLNDLGRDIVTKGLREQEQEKQKENDIEEISPAMMGR